LIASVHWKADTITTAEASTPTVSQLATVPDVARVGNRHRKHAVSPGITVIDIPVDPTAPPGVVEQIPRLEVVRAVQDDVCPGDQSLHVVAGHIRHDRRHRHAGVDPPDRLGGRDGLRSTGQGIGLVEQQLTLQVGQLDEVPVHHGDAAHP
jgi:hypothetical protein